MSSFDEGKSRTCVSKRSEEIQNKPAIDVYKVFLFVPNLIGYLRIFLAGVALYYLERNTVYCVISYCISCALDALDGFAARHFNQCSKFGAVLDMVTDRCTTTCLLCYLAHIYPKWSIFFQFLISLDVSSHYMHMYSSLTSGATSHKSVSKTHNFLLQAYYNSKVVLFLVCAGNELFFIALYLKKAEPVFQGTWVWLAILMFPVFLFKNILNVIQFSGAARSLAQIDFNEHHKSS